jgi:hypothetical protein
MMVLDFLFSRRFNWFDMFVYMLAPLMITHVGWWTVLILIVCAVFSVSAENRLRG